jgi:hypothetical protein
MVPEPRALGPGYRESVRQSRSSRQLRLALEPHLHFHAVQGRHDDATGTARPLMIEGNLLVKGEAFSTLEVEIELGFRLAVSPVDEVFDETFRVPLPGR